MAYGKQMFISDTDAHDFVSVWGKCAEYVEVIEEGTTFHTYTVNSNLTLLEQTDTALNKLADASTAGYRFSFSKGDIIRIPCNALQLASGAVIAFQNPVEA